MWSTREWNSPSLSRNPASACLSAVMSRATPMMAWGLPAAFRIKVALLRLGNRVPSCLTMVVSKVCVRPVSSNVWTNRHDPGPVLRRNIV